MSSQRKTDEKRQALSLAEAAHCLLEECRMVLPGVQALFGFQLIAVFNERFASKLSTAQQSLHLGAIALVALSAALVMTPAAYHREVEPREVSEAFLRRSSRLLVFSMLPLAAGINLDFYLVAQLILGQFWISLLLSLLLFFLFMSLWFFYPWSRRRAP